MFVIRLPNGNLQVPQTAVHTGDGRIIGDVYVEIGPDDTDYARLAEQALTPDEVEERKSRGARATPRCCGSSRSSPGSSMTNTGLTPYPEGSGGPGNSAEWASVSPRSRARTSDSRNRRCPPGVRMLVIRPDAAQRVTVFGSTRNRAATSPGVSSRSLLPSTFHLLESVGVCP